MGGRIIRYAKLTTMNQKPSSASLQRRRLLTVIIALLFSGAIFAPMVVALYRDGSVFWLLIMLLLWLGCGRFAFHLLTPKQNGRPEAARDESTDQGQ